MPTDDENLIKWIRGKGGWHDWPVDDAIKPLIALLNACGLRTTTSCSGIESQHENPISMGTPYICFDEQLKPNRKLIRQMDEIFESAGFQPSGRNPNCYHYSLTEIDIQKEMEGGPSAYDILDAIPEEHIERAWDELFTDFLNLCIKKAGRKK
jgi:hypothetical protein